MHAISSYRGNRPTNTHIKPQTGQITIHCTAASLARSVVSVQNDSAKLQAIKLQSAVISSSNIDYSIKTGNVSKTIQLLNGKLHAMP